MKKKILIVDDLVMVLDMLSTYLLDRFEVEVYTENAATKVISRIQEIHPDILILDIIMPDQCGDSIANELKEYPEFNDMKIIFFSGMISAVEAKSYNVNNSNNICISKSTGLNGILNCIRELL